MNKFERRHWIFAAALTLPVLVFFTGYLFHHPSSLIPTGFIQYDNAAYIAYARQYLDAGQWNLQYANPFGYEGPSIYFQPQTLFFACLLKLGVPPGSILIPFTVVCSLICFRLLISIYDHILPLQRFRTFHILLFAWGGGLLVVAGVAVHYLLQRNGSVFKDLFLLDPEGGWWGLNLGRSLFFSCEAYYHAIFLGCILSLIKRKWVTGIGLLLLLSLSHPFTGIELISIVAVWCFIELVINKKTVPLWFMTGVMVLFALHLYFYLVYLKSFPDHHSVSQQYALNWKLGWYRIIPAYCLVGCLVMGCLISFRKEKFFSIPDQRLLISWFLVAFLLSNHEIFMNPRQPIHFTRGYIWTSLFLLGLPYLADLNNRIYKKWMGFGLVVVGALFLMDNFLWITLHTAAEPKVASPTYITKEQQQVLNILSQQSSNETIIISNDNTIAYLSAVYTQGVPWYSHPFTTPYADRKKSAQQLFFATGIPDSSWKGHDINMVLTLQEASFLRNFKQQPAKIFSTKNYILYTYRPFL